MTKTHDIDSRQVIKVFVTVGTNHNNFDRMLEIVNQCLLALITPYDLYVQYGWSSVYTVPQGVKGEAKAMFSREEARHHVATSDLVFSHCGIGSIHSALEFSRPTVIIPRLEKHGEFTDDHQLQIAQEIRNNPLVYMIDSESQIFGFSQFYEGAKGQPKVAKDLTNHRLAQRMKQELTNGDDQNQVLTVVSAGGHLTQAMCLMRSVKKFHLVTSVDTGLDVGAQSYQIIKSTQFNALVHMKNIFVALKRLFTLRPHVVFSTGGPICIPWAVAAKILRIPFMYLDTLSRVEDLSNTARFLRKYRLAKLIYVQWSHHEKKYPDLEYVGKTFDICGENDQ